MFQANKKLLPFIFLIAILTSSIFIPAATAAGNVGKLSDSSFYDSNNNLYVVGEVINTGDVAIQNTNVKVIFYNSLDQKITSIEGYTDLNVILPQRKSFFNIKMLETEGSLNVDSYTIWFNWTDTAAGKPLGLVILSSSDNIDSNGYKHVTGQIQNQGTVNSNNTEVSATFYNSSGVVVGTSWVFSNPSNLAPNQIGEFDIQLNYPQQVTQVASYSLTAESTALAYSPIPLPTPTPTPIETTPPSSSPNATPTPPPPTASPSNSLTPSTSPSGSPSPTTIVSPNPSSTENTAVLIAVIAAIIIIIIAIFVIYSIKKKKLHAKVEGKQV